MGKSIRYTMSSLHGLGRLDMNQIRGQMNQLGFDLTPPIGHKKDVDGITFFQGEAPYIPAEPQDTYSLGRGVTETSF